MATQAQPHQEVLSSDTMESDAERRRMESRPEEIEGRLRPATRAMIVTTINISISVTPDS